MLEIAQEIKKHVDILMKCLPILSLIIPLSVLYYLYPETFEMTWEGRTYYLFFVWLMLMETIMNQEKLRPRWGAKSVRTILFIMALSLPTIYVIGANYYGWNGAFLDLAKNSKIPFANYMPLSIEYLVFTALFVVIAFAAYGITGLKNYSITAVFLGAIGAVYTVNNLYPYGLFTPFQIFVPSTTMLAAAFLNMMGYHTNIFYAQSPEQGSLPVLSVDTLHGPVAFKVAWPCSGIDSLLIYSVTILLFLKGSTIPWKQKIAYFSFGAIITYFINALRIATIFVIAANGGDITAFHNYYGPLYSITWIILYPIAIIASRALWEKVRTWRIALNQGSKTHPPTNLPRQTPYPRLNQSPIPSQAQFSQDLRILDKQTCDILNVPFTTISRHCKEAARNKETPFNRNHTDHKSTVHRDSRPRKTRMLNKK